MRSNTARIPQVLPARIPDVNYHAYTVIKREGGPDFWLDIGEVEVQGDGQGFTITLNALPIDGKIICRRHYPKAENGREE